MEGGGACENAAANALRIPPPSPPLHNQRIIHRAARDRPPPGHVLGRRNAGMAERDGAGRRRNPARSRTARRWFGGRARRRPGVAREPNAGRQGQRSGPTLGEGEVVRLPQPNSATPTAPEWIWMVSSRSAAGNDAIDGRGGGRVLGQLREAMGRPSSCKRRRSSTTGGSLASSIALVRPSARTRLLRQLSVPHPEGPNSRAS
jgi:hypothetical protein